MLTIAALEPYAALSHARFLEGLARHSSHAVEALTLPARAWKWRMRTAALHYAELLAERPPCDLYLASDYLALAELYALLPAPQRDVPAIVYFHENQLTYPLQPGERRDHHFALTHLYSGLCARAVVFNSQYHRTSFLAALGELLGHVPDVDVASAHRRFAERSSVLPLGHDLEPPPERTVRDGPPTILWNHRWEYDKDPEAFVAALEELADDGVPFRVRVLGQRFRTLPPAFAALEERLGERLATAGFVAERADYAAELARADVVVSTARHEFFGLATLEALAQGALPVLPHALAYPELVPASLRRAPWLYPPAEGPAAALREVLGRLGEPAAAAAREAFQRHAGALRWPLLAPRYDRLFEAVAGRERSS